MSKVVILACGYLGLFLGLFLAADTFMPRSGPTTLGVLAGEFLIGLAIAGSSCVLIRLGRSAPR